jgi:uncharacterized protein (DUF169 family)
MEANSMTSNAEMAAALQDRLRLDSAPVAVKLVGRGDAPPDGLIERSKRLSFCQFVVAAATGGYPFLVSGANLGCFNAKMAFGLYDPETDSGAVAKAVQTHVGIYAPDTPSAEALISSKPAVAPGAVNGVAVAPLAKAAFQPDAVILLVVPAQAYFALDDYMYASCDSSVQFEIGTNSLVCAYCAVRAAFLDRISLTPACTGGRNYAGIERTQMTLAFPASKLDALMEGLRDRSRRVPYPGMIAMPAPIPMPPKHILMPEGGTGN